MTALAATGWAVLPWDARVAAWAAAAERVARDVVADPAMRARWLRHGGTWFVGVDALPNGPDGSVGGVAFAGAWDEVLDWRGPWHRAQLSVVWPGYPQADADESPAAVRFRRDRDGAHLDGLLAEGPEKRRHLREPHAFVLGLPLTQMDAGRAPFVVWEGSHAIIGRAFASAFAGVAPQDWGALDVTEVYQSARREVFETCRRVEVTAGPGEAILCHRRAIHGTAPWRGGPDDPRMVAWFRPVLDDVGMWLAD